MHKIGIIGLGYVGLPLSVEFSKHYKVVGYDISEKRINDLKKNIDQNKEISRLELNKSKKLTFTNNLDLLRNCNVYIITVPTPINNLNKPDLKFIKKATIQISKFITKKNFIIYESTVYPGLTNDILIPLIEKQTKLKLNIDFFCGYSPERVNPGDMKRKLKNIKKIVSGSNNYALKFISNLYSKIITAGVHKASSIKIAEAAKVIENCQRDINIAFVNELSIIFDRMNLNTNEILKAASTKWNFINYKPGLVGGHCIGVDPYYLTYQAKKYGYNSKIILSGRSLNNQMANFVVKKVISKLKENNFQVKNSKILIMGFTFKENCSDIRNSKIFDVVNIAKKQFKTVDIYDPIANRADVKSNYKINLIKNPKNNFYDVIILLVNHKFFLNMGLKKILKFSKKKSIIYDFKNIFNLNKEISRKNEISI